MIIRACLVLVTSVGVLLGHETQSEACGVNQVPKSRAPKIKKGSQNPSQILLLGHPPRALATKLKEQGHSVEVARDPDIARRARYHLIVADENQVEAATRRWPGILVVTRSGSATAERVENRLARAPSRELVKRVTRAQSQVRTPRRVGPTVVDRRTPTQAGSGRVTKAAAGSDSAPTRIQARDTPSSTDRPMDSNRVAMATTNRKRTQAGGEVRGALAPALAKRVYFGSGSAAITGRFQRKLIRTAQWMLRNPGKTITVEGHADTTGIASVNQAISDRRAEAVKRFLVGQGVEASRISTRGVGSERPEFQPGSSGKNRRVLIAVD